MKSSFCHHNLMIWVCDFLPFPCPLIPAHAVTADNKIWTCKSALLVFVKGGVGLPPSPPLRATWETWLKEGQSCKPPRTALFFVFTTPKHPSALLPPLLYPPPWAPPCSALVGHLPITGPTDVSPAFLPKCSGRTKGASTAGVNQHPHG